MYNVKLLLILIQLHKVHSKGRVFHVIRSKRGVILVSVMPDPCLFLHKYKHVLTLRKNFFSCAVRATKNTKPLPLQISIMTSKNISK